MASDSRQILKRANPSTIHDKFLVGYQGWFTCAGDGDPIDPGHHGWLHWFNQPIPDGGRPNTDVWPDVSSYSPSELFPAPGLKTKSGEQTFLFSSRNAKTVQRHFHWMAEHGVDGAFLQRFAGQCDLEKGSKGIRRLRDEVGERVREAAEREGRVFAIMYDVSGVPADRIQRVLQQDWVHLVRELGVLDSPNYLREGGKPVIALWGFGFDNRGHTPTLVREITKFFRNTTPGGVYIMAGTPTHWRTSEGDADRNPEFVEVWLNEFDAISPWTVGRYGTERDADNYAEQKMKGDLELITSRNQEGNKRKVDYIPVVLPGFSGYNLSQGNWGFNQIKREGGRYLWRQIYNARQLGVRTMYGAMWDEYDEGTAFMPIVEHKRNLPESDMYQFLSLDEDGYDVPSDWYMRICGFAAEGLRSERRIHQTFPVKELQDYWSSRPKYEDVNSKSKDFRSGSLLTKGDGSVDPNGSGGGQTYQEWLALQKEEKEEVPPPPYTLESDGSTDNNPIPAQTASNADVRAAAPAPAPAVVTTSSGVLSGAVRDSPAVTNAQSVASSSYAAASPPTVNINTYPATHELYSQISAQSPQPHLSAPGHSPQPHLSPVHGQQSVSPSQGQSQPHLSPVHRQQSLSPQRHSPQPHLSPVHGQQSVSPTQGHSPQQYPPSGVSQYSQSQPLNQPQSHQPYPPVSGQPVQSYPPHAGSPHSQPYPPAQGQTSQQYRPTSGQGQHPQSYPPAGNLSYQGYSTSPGHSQGYPPAGAPSQGYTPQSTQPYPPSGGPVHRRYPSVDVTPPGHSQGYPPAGAPSQGYISPNAQSTQPYPPSGGPVHQGYPPVDAQNYSSYYNHNQSQEVATLANEFGRQSISVPSGGSVGGRLPTPPPLHPTHPNYQTRPSTSSLNSTPPANLPSRPQSLTGSAARPPPSPAPPAVPANRPRWPPAEWDSDVPPVPHFSGRRPSTTGNGSVGANLTRPQTAGAPSSYNPVEASSLRPTLSMSTKPSRPHTTSNTNMSSGYYSPTADTTSPSFPTGPAMHDGYVPFPSGPQYNSSYMPSSYPDQPPYNPAAQGSWPASGPPIAFPGSPMGWNIPESSYTPGMESQYPGGPTFPSTYSSGPPDQVEQFHPFPEGPGSGAYSGSNVASSSSTPPWTSGGSEPPPMHFQSQGSLPGRTSSTSGGRQSNSSALGYALSAVDKVAGRKARNQLESRVDTIAHSGNKLFNKFK